MKRMPKWTRVSCVLGIWGSMALVGAAAEAAKNEGPGPWAKRFALQKGFMNRVISGKVAKKSPGFAQQVRATLAKLNGVKGRLRGCSEKARLALANLAVSAVHRPKIRMGRVMRGALRAFEKAIGTGRWSQAATALEATQYRLRRAFDRFQKRIDWSIRWLRQRCGAKPGRAGRVAAVGAPSKARTPALKRGAR